MRSILLLVLFLLFVNLCIGRDGGDDDEDDQDDLLLVRIAATHIPLGHKNDNTVLSVVHRTPEFVDVLVRQHALEDMRKRLPRQRPFFQILQDDVELQVSSETRRRMRRTVYPRAGFFEEFRSLDEFNLFLNDTAGKFPELVSLVQFPELSDENRLIRGVKITSSSNQNALAPKRAILVIGNIHAREWLSGMSVAWAIEHLCTSYGTNANTTLLLDNFEWHLFPISNPDGFAFSQQAAANRMWRKTRTRNAGNPNCIGIDPNRNMVTPNWGVGASSDECSDVFKGYSQLSTGCTRGLAAYSTALHARSPIAMYVDQHCYFPSWTSVWGHQPGFPAEYAEMTEYMRTASTAIGGVNDQQVAWGTAANLLGVAAGGTDDYHYEQFGVVASFTSECRGPGFVRPPSDIPLSGAELLEGYKAVALRVLTRIQQSTATTIAEQTAATSATTATATTVPPLPVVGLSIGIAIFVLCIGAAVAGMLWRRFKKKTVYVGEPDSAAAGASNLDIQEYE